MGALRIETPREAPAFSEWLGAICERYDLTARSLTHLFIRAGGDISEQTVRDWMKGTYEPNARKLSLLLGALDEAIPGFDIYESMTNFMRGRTYLPPKRRKGTPTTTAYSSQIGPDLRRRGSGPTYKSRKPPGGHTSSSPPDTQAA